MHLRIGSVSQTVPEGNMNRSIFWGGSRLQLTGSGVDMADGIMTLSLKELSLDLKVRNIKMLTI